MQLEHSLCDLAHEDIYLNLKDAYLISCQSLRYTIVQRDRPSPGSKAVPSQPCIGVGRCLSLFAGNVDGSPRPSWGILRHSGDFAVGLQAALPGRVGNDHRR